MTLDVGGIPKFKYPLQKEAIAEFKRSGVVYIENLYDDLTEINPIRKRIYELLGQMIHHHKLDVHQGPFHPERFDSALAHILKYHRPLAGVLYEAVKKLPEFVSWAVSSTHTLIAQCLLATDFVGLANRGIGIRMDHPYEDKYLTQLHQDYHSQLISPRGLIIWSPLRSITKDMGPLLIYPETHLGGIREVDVTGDEPYGIQIHDPQKSIGSSQGLRPQINARDAAIIDYLTLHQSSPNRSPYTRWAMVARFFDFKDPMGCSHGWAGGLQEGNHFGHRHPEWTYWKKIRSGHD